MKEFRSLEHIIRNIVEGNDDRNTNIRRKVENVGRPADNVKDETSKLAKQGEIKTKIVDEDVAPEAAPKEPKMEVDDDKKKKSDKDDVDAGKIKGGKTEVDLEPKTNDSYHPGPDSTGTENDAKKVKNQAMKKAGVKEETMFKSDNTFGLPADLIATVAEALKGGQKKIDANHNGKIDGQDFKILRGEKKKMEEEAVEEGHIPANYAVSHKDVRAQMDKERETYAAAKKEREKAKQQTTKEEIEQIYERNNENKAKKDAAVQKIGSQNKDDQHLGSRGMRTSVADKIRGREVTQGQDRKQYKEEVEQIDELSRGTLHKYVQKSHKQTLGVDAVGMGTKKSGIPGHYRGKNKDLGKDPAHKVRMRKSGQALAIKKLNKEDFSAEEFARLEEISKSFHKESFDEATKKSEPMATTIVSSPLRGPKQDYSGVNDKNNTADYTISDEKSKVNEDAQTDQLKQQMQAKKQQIQKQLMQKKMAVMQAKAAKQMSKIKAEEVEIDEAASAKQKQYMNRVKTNPGRKGSVVGATSNFEAPYHKVHAVISKNGGEKETVKHEVQAKDKHDAMFNVQMSHHKAGHKVHDTKYKGLKEEEQLDELSKETLKSYVSKVDKRKEAMKRGTGLNVASQKIAKQEPTSTLKKTVDSIKKMPHGKLKSSTVNKFFASHAELQKRNVKEEQIDELSNATLSSYKSKAAGSEAQHTDKSSSLSVPAKQRNVHSFKANQRRIGMKLADKKMAEEVELDEAKRGRPRKNPTESDPGSENIIMQLRKVITLRGQEPVTFADGHKSRISPSAAHQALARYDNLKTTGEKHAFSLRLHRSMDSMRDAIMGKAAEPAKPKVSLAGKITGNQREE